MIKLNGLRVFSENIKQVSKGISQANAEFFKTTATKNLKEMVEKIFDSEGSYGGHLRWLPLKGKNRHPLLKTGRLKRSIKALSIKRNKLEFGTRLAYAPVHQYGKENIPKREFLYLPKVEVDKALELALDIYIRHIRRTLN